MIPNTQYALCGYNRTTWREQFLREITTGTWHVVVRSLPEDAVEPANVEKASLQKRFPNLDFDVIPTENLDGGNPRIAIVVASGLGDPHLADKIANFARDMGIEKNSYKKMAK